MLPGSQEYNEARELCKKMAAIDLPSESFPYGEPMALMGAMALKLPAALDTIDDLTNQTEELRTSVKFAVTIT